MATKPPAWRERVIKLRLVRDILFGQRGERPAVQASVLGPLAVHPTYDGKTEQFSETDFTVTHLGTKLAIRKGLSREAAVEIAEGLVQLNWDFNSAHKVPAETKAGAKELLGRYPKGARA